MTNIALLDVDQPAIAAEGPAEADVAAIPAPGAVIAVDGEQAASVTVVDTTEGIAAVGEPSRTMVAVSPAPKLETATGAFLTIAALPITTSREGVARAAQLVVDLGLSNSLTVAALPITTSREVAARVAQLVVDLGLPNSLTVAAAI